MLVGAAVASFLLSGCGAGPGSGVLPRDIAKIVDGYDCLAPNLNYWAFPPDSTIAPDPEHPYAPKAGWKPEGFAPTTAVRCDVVADIDEPQRFSITAVTFGGDLTELLAALAEPDDGDDSTAACTADWEFVPPLWLVDEAGQAIHARYPVDVCGKTKPGVRDALAALPVLDSTMMKLKEVQPLTTPDGETLVPALP
ncbi:hypothetical protein [Cryobacterium sp. PAMC25264]|uniref:hypothetical protein n=1 Tax=Cryobacterium sp. PAMC25264 TaxID=2861288 RepID=UPI001C626AA8|nr:hypothetical protein [Cryobacterium sp. PAMC25264]QYF72327.1 hypothetical protein KY500_10735 [Cryobacterium sp. PAMC25264]